jgi:hypothetical protein
MARIFISYASSDHDFVEREVDGLLKALGFETWFAPANIRSAELWEQSIAVGLDSSDWFLLLVSSCAASSAWVKRELSWAFDNLPDRIIPFVIDDTDPGRIDERLRTIQHLDYGTDRTLAVQRLVQRLVDAQYRGFQRSLGGQWLCAVQPVYYSRRRRYRDQPFPGRWIRALRSHGSGAETAWHVQDVQINPSVTGYVVDTLPAEATLQWRWNAGLVGNAFLAGSWASKRESSDSHGYMSVQISRNGTYMFGHDYAVVLEEAKAHFGVLLLGKTEGALAKAWSAMRGARRDMPPLTYRIDFPSPE